MFKDYTFPEWVDILAVASFLIVSVIFLIIVVRALRMSKHEVKRLSHLPLEDASNSNSKPDKL